MCSADARWLWHYKDQQFFTLAVPTLHKQGHGVLRTYITWVTAPEVYPIPGEGSESLLP